MDCFYLSMNISFPLLHLPHFAILEVIDTLDCLQLVGFSLLSKKCKHFVFCLGLNFQEIIVDISKYFEIVWPLSDTIKLRFCLYTVEENGPTPKLGIPYDFIIDKEKNYRWINSNRLNVEEFIDHFKTIFRIKKVVIELNTDSHRYDLESIHNIARKVPKLRLAIENHEFNQKALDLFQPNELNFKRLALQNDRVPGHVFIQNLHSIRVESPTIQLSLDDLLIMNSLEIRMNEVTLTGKDLNRFMKLWMKGSNPRLEILQLASLDISRFEDTWKGIKYQETGSNEEIRFSRSTGFNQFYNIEEGRHIYRMDGTKATCLTRISNGYFIFEMCVWHEHCKMN